MTTGDQRMLNSPLIRVYMQIEVGQTTKEPKPINIALMQLLLMTAAK